MVVRAPLTCSHFCPRRCKHTPVSCTPSANQCVSVACAPASGTCESSPVNSAFCNGCQANSCPPINACTPRVCITDCSDPRVTGNTCTNDRNTNGFYCQPTPVVCPADDSCQTWACVDGQCRSTPRCTTNDPCSTPTCQVPGGCVNIDVCTDVVLADKCQEPVCSTDVSNANGYSCDSPTAPRRDCTDYNCKATGISSKYLVGKFATQFLLQYAAVGATCTPVTCTVDRCDPAQGCVNDQLGCDVPVASCNATIGCFEAGNADGFVAGVCQIIVVAGLFDLCGRCLGDNVDCFFQTVLPVSTVAGIATGVAVAIALAAVVAVLLGLWLSKRGYDYYQARSQMHAAGMHNNPYFAENNMAGQMPTGPGQ